MDQDASQDLFDAAASHVAGLVSSGTSKLPSDVLVKFYGFYKQALEGDCTTAKPAFWDLSGRSKWAAWDAVRGLPSDNARQAYVQLLDSCVPDWRESAGGVGAGGKANGGAWGPVFSRPADCGDQEADGQAGPANAHRLHEAAAAGDVEALEQLLGSGASHVGERDECGATPLHLAADRGACDAAGLLIERGAEVDARDDDGMTPLHYAALCSRREMCELLLQHAANLLHDNDGKLPQQLAPAAWECWPV